MKAQILWFYDCVCIINDSQTILVQELIIKNIVLFFYGQISVAVILYQALEVSVYSASDQT